MPRTKTIHTWLPPLLSPLLVVVLWQAVIQWQKLPPVLLPGPLKVLSAAWEGRDKLAAATLVTVSEALAAFGLSIVVGTAIAMLFSQSSLIRRSFYPYAIFLQTVPIVAVAPLIVIWIGEGFLAVVTIAFIISLFPIITNVTDGLLSVPSGLHELFRLNGASRLQTLGLLQFPAALPHLVTGAKIASGSAVLGAIVGDYFVGTGDRQGLGYLIFARLGQFRLDFLFAAIIVCTLLGVAVFFAIDLVARRLILYWVDDDRPPR